MKTNKILISVVCGALAAAALYDAKPEESTDSAVRLPGMTTAPFVGEIMWVPFDFAPRGWELCNGQTLQVENNPALFSVIGTIYGGDGETTFALPDLRGRMPMHHGQGTGLTNRTIGSKGGFETITLTVSDLPSHTHALKYNPNNEGGTAQSVLLSDKAFTAEAPVGSVDVIGATGDGNAIDNMPPFLTLNAVIAVEGELPTQG